MNIPTNTTPTEYARYYCNDEQASAFILQSIEDAKEVIAEQEAEAKRMEVIEEQLYFATELIEQVQTIVDQSTRAKDIKAGIKIAIENSFLEM